MKNRLILSVILGIILTLGWVTVSESALSDISSGLIRLHILANSDGNDDQLLKLKVRDRLLSEADTSSGELNLSHIKEICRDEIIKNGYDYNVSVSYGKFYFPTKTYENITLPAGDYEALRVVIGKGEGKNWWCVMYPPLCFSDNTFGSLSSDELTQLKESMKEENFSLIENSEIKLKPAFKIIELWQKVRHVF